ncbi:MAG: hypothetical protein OZ921_12660 [Sorangiineae bacterium]|nr:hypothetical protein [Polyangiaceae bacterium]MEB2323358.1 hypothetical protein [Sorangiineae bacterium]
MKRGFSLTGALVVGVVSFAGPARATDAMRFPDNGTEQLGRGGAWVARATNPLATLYNPAALATQETGVLLDVNGVFFKTCFTREGPGSNVTVGASGVAKYPTTCNSNSGTPSPLPSAAFVWRATDQLGIGLSVTPPSLYGHTEFPETVPLVYKSASGRDISTQVGSPQRYMLLKMDGIVLNQTLSAGYSLTDRLHLGAGFIWGVGSLSLQSAAMSLPPDDQTQDDPTADIWARVKVADWFIPGFVIGGLYSPIDQLDIGLSITAQEALESHGDLTLKANYWTGDPRRPIGSNPTITESPGTTHFRLPNPFDVRLGVRFHLPRAERGTVRAAATGRAVRDPLVDDVFDIELDGSYTRNRAYSAVMLRFPEVPPIPINGTGGVVPGNGDMALNLEGDTFGVRLGGDYNVIPGRLAVRAGGWYEPSVQRARDLSVTLVASQRVGAAAGVTVRLGRFDLEAGYLHVFFAEQDNGGEGNVRAMSGKATAQPVPYRTPYPINGGRLTASANIVSLGATMRF